MKLLVYFLLKSHNHLEIDQVLGGFSVESENCD